MFLSLELHYYFHNFLSFSYHIFLNTKLYQYFCYYYFSQFCLFQNFSGHFFYSFLSYTLLHPLFISLKVKIIIKSLLLNIQTTFSFMVYSTKTYCPWFQMSSNCFLFSSLNLNTFCYYFYYVIVTYLEHIYFSVF